MFEARCSSVVERLLMVRWVIGSFPFGGPIKLFLISASAPTLVYKDRGMCYLLCGMVHIKYSLNIITKNNTFSDGSRFPL